MKKFALTKQIWMAAMAIQFCCLSSYAQIGNLIWEDNFNTFNTAIWNPIEGNGCEIGLCGWGNAELEYYHPNNINIEAIPGEAGNNALVLQAQRETVGSNSFTSGKVDSENKLSVQYGLIEIRMRTPNLETGLWPAAWLLGTANVSWPAKGEIDMMEMGHAAAERANQGYPGSDINSYVGANAIFAAEDGSVASIAYDINYNKPYVASSSMTDRFVTYRLYWEPTQMRYTVIDNGTEYDLYEGPLPLDPNSITGVFNKPFYFLLNLAVGGNFTDAAVPGQVTASLPSKLYVDYVRVYEWNGFGEVQQDYSELTPEQGTFGIFTEETPTNSQLAFGQDAEIYVWGGTMQNGTETAFEGSEVIAWETLNANSWFGGGIVSTFGRDMSGYVEEGTLKFNIKIPDNVSFRIGLTDNFTNEQWLEFPAGETKYGLVRNGNWGSVEIPLVDFAGLLAFQNMNYMFAISSLDGAFPTSTFQMGIDNIVWEDGNGTSTNIPVTGITTTPANISLTVGSTQNISSSISPSNATNQNISWSTNNPTVATVNNNGLVTAIASGNATVTATTADGNFTDNTAVSVSSNTTTFIPDPSKTYYIDNRQWNVRLGANGSQDAFTTSTNTTGDDVEWVITPASTAGYYYLDCVGGGNLPRLRSDQSINADMQGTSSGGTWASWMLTDVGNGYFYLSTLNNSNFMRLQVNNLGNVRTVAANFTGNWTHFTFTEASGNSSNFNLKIEAEDYTAMNGIQTQETLDDDTLNVGWIDTGDWMDYTVNIPSSGTYTINSRVASVPGNAAVQFQVNGQVLATTNIASTGDWQEWTTVSTTLNLAAGTQTLRLYSVGDGFNINWFEISSGSNAAKTIGVGDAVAIKAYPNPVTDQLFINANGVVFDRIQIVDLNGKVVAQNSTNNLENINVSTLGRGLYLVRILSNNQLIKVIKIVK